MQFMGMRSRILLNSAPVWTASAFGAFAALRKSCMSNMARICMQFTGMRSKKSEGLNGMCSASLTDGRGAIGVDHSLHSEKDTMSVDMGRGERSEE